MGALPQQSLAWQQNEKTKIYSWQSADKVTSALSLRHSTSKHASAAFASAAVLREGRLRIPDHEGVLPCFVYVDAHALPPCSIPTLTCFIALHGCVQRRTADATDALMAYTKSVCINTHTRTFNADAYCDVYPTDGAA